MECRSPGARGRGAGVTVKGLIQPVLLPETHPGGTVTLEAPVFNDADTDAVGVRSRGRRMGIGGWGVGGAIRGSEGVHHGHPSGRRLASLNKWGKRGCC